MKNIILSILLGFALMALTGCYESESSTATETKKCQSGKCGDAKETKTNKAETPAE